MDTDEKAEYELTSNPVDGTMGFICRVHGIHRAGLTQPHAINVERKHIREDHPEDDAVVPLNLNLGALAREVRHMLALAESSPYAREHGIPDPHDLLTQKAETFIVAWGILTGTRRPESLVLAEKMAEADPPQVAYLPPF